ncbi:hypothetical protein [Methylobacterium fujisawaense]|uniref:hypothetical protein n=1 Tax=Methylobacterium fujisawaense TaxID=107400 RepID=UPI0036F90A85
MDIIPFPNREVGAAALLSRHHVQNSQDDGWGACRAAQVEDAAVRAAMDIESFCCLTAATRHAYERLQRISNTTLRRAYIFRPDSREFAALAYAEQLAAGNYPGAAWLDALCDMLPCEPSADEAVQGLCKALRWVLRPANIVRFGFSRDQGRSL